MGKIIILEGPDFSGKSTLARSIATLSRIPVTIVTNGAPPSVASLAGHYMDQVAAARSREGLTVFDRLHVGELVYGPLWRGSSLIDEAEAKEIDWRLDEAAAEKVFVRVPPDTLLERFHGPRGDDLVLEPKTLLSIAAKYDDYFAHLSGVAPWRIWDGRESDCRELLGDGR